MDERYLSESSVIHAIGDIHPLDYNGQGIVERIKAIPAADVKPVVRGKWIFDDFDGDGYDYQCPCCSMYAKKPSNYCPNCGADMREQEVKV